MNGHKGFADTVEILFTYLFICLLVFEIRPIIDLEPTKQAEVSGQ